MVWFFCCCFCYCNEQRNQVFLKYTELPPSLLWQYLSCFEPQWMSLQDLKLRGEKKKQQLSEFCYHCWRNTGKWSFGGRLDCKYFLHPLCVHRKSFVSSLWKRVFWLSAEHTRKIKALWNLHEDIGTCSKQQNCSWLQTRLENSVISVPDISRGNIKVATHKQVNEQGVAH